VMAVTPEDFVNLSNRLYDWPVLYSALPVAKDFLWLDLSRPDFLLAILVGLSMYVQQKMTAPVTTDPAQAAQGRITTFMMPAMFTFFAITFPSGLALYWLASTAITIVIQYFVAGWGSLSFNFDVITRFLGRDQSPRKPAVNVEKAPARETPKETAPAAVEEVESLPVADSEETSGDSGGSHAGKGKKKRSGKSKRRKRK
jgi:YidC/Oxa1 family membrane protein insertase